MLRFSDESMVTISCRHGKCDICRKLELFFGKRDWGGERVFFFPKNRLEVFFIKGNDKD